MRDAEPANRAAIRSIASRHGPAVCRSKAMASVLAASSARVAVPGDAHDRSGLCRHDLVYLIGVIIDAALLRRRASLRRCAVGGVGRPGYRVRILLDLRRVDVGAGNAAREQAVAGPGTAPLSPAWSGGSVKGSSVPILCHVLTSVAGCHPRRTKRRPRPCRLRPVLCIRPALPLTRPDYSVVAREPAP